VVRSDINALGTVFFFFFFLGNKFQGSRNKYREQGINIGSEKWALCLSMEDPLKYLKKKNKRHGEIGEIAGFLSR
jgi:hypothetical protein